MGAYSGSAGRIASSIDELRQQGWHIGEVEMSNESTIYYNAINPEGQAVIVGDRFDPPNPADEGCYVFGDPGAFRQALAERKRQWESHQTKR